MVSNRGLQGGVQRDWWKVALSRCDLDVVSAMASFSLLVPGALVHGLGASARPLLKIKEGELAQHFIISYAAV